MTAPVRLQRRDGVAVLTLDRADRLNALGTAMVDALRVALEEIANDTSVRALVVTGSSDAPGHGWPGSGTPVGHAGPATLCCTGRRGRRQGWRPGPAAGA